VFDCGEVDIHDMDRITLPAHELSERSSHDEDRLAPVLIPRLARRVIEASTRSGPRDRAPGRKD